MTNKPEPSWQPIRNLPMIANMIDGQLGDAQEQYTNLLEARQKPYVLDDYTVNRDIQVYTEQIEFVPIYKKQLEKWQKEASLTAIQQSEIKQLQDSFINVLFHGDESMLGSLAAEAVFKQNPDLYWEFHKELFKAQPSEDHDSLWITPEKIIEIGRKFTNIDIEKLKTDIEQQTVINDVNNDLELVQELNIQQTPTILINDTIVNDPFRTPIINNKRENKTGNN